MLKRLDRVLRRHWWVQAVAILAIAATDLWIIVERDRVTPVELADVLGEFRAGAPTSTAPPSAPAVDDGSDAARSDPANVGPTLPPVRVTEPGKATPGETTTSAFQPSTTVPHDPGGVRAPRPGVYTYETSGGESLGPASHEYPERTHAIVQATDCGWTFDHRVIEEHTDKYWYCMAGGVQRLVAWASTREFLRLSLDEDYVCGGDAWIPAVDGARVSVACTTDDEDRIDFTFTRDGMETLSIAGTPVDTVRLGVRGDIAGNPDGTVEGTLWLDPGTGLRVREVRSVRAQVQAGGTSEYREDAEFTLASLTPQE